MRDLLPAAEGSQDLTVMFGGTFDPVHTGHVTAVKNILKTVPDIRRFIIMPAFVNPFKVHSTQRASAEQRLEMCRIAYAGLEKCVISDMEIKAGGVSYTINTLERIRAQYPYDRLAIALGGDTLKDMPTWYRSQDIIDMCSIFAVRRVRRSRINEYADNIRAMGGTVNIIDCDPFEISSTELRKRFSEGRDVSGYIPPEVVEYIKENNIYG